MLFPIRCQAFDNAADVDADYSQLTLMAGYDHCYEVVGTPGATLSDPASGRTMHVVTDCPGIQIYTANDLQAIGKATTAAPSVWRPSTIPMRCIIRNGHSRL